MHEQGRVKEDFFALAGCDTVLAFVLDAVARILIKAGETVHFQHKCILLQYTYGSKIPGMHDHGLLENKYTVPKGC